MQNQLICILGNKIYFYPFNKIFQKRRMKKLVLIAIALISISATSLAKDTNAWKNEQTLEQQYQVFKENLNFWSGNYFLSESQLNDFFGANLDSIAELETRLAASKSKINQQKSELAEKQKLINETQQNLDESKKLQNSITVLGLDINKSLYSTVMYLFILGVLVLAGFMYMLFQKGYKVARQTQKEYDELKKEYEQHKKTSLDRYTKINMELHKTRLELQKK